MDPLALLRSDPDIYTVIFIPDCAILRIYSRSRDERMFRLDKKIRKIKETKKI